MVVGYLAGELASNLKHESLDGEIHAVAGGTANHSAVATNFTGVMSALSDGKNCRLFNSDLKVRLELPSQTRFDYPDASVTCGIIDGQAQFIENPVILVEVLSPSTRRIDLTEKKEAYLTLTSLKVLLMIEPDFPHVTAHRRSPDGGFDLEVYRS